ncbi:MAG TPA: hypothetical protein VGC30_02180 [Dokdonella sp.]
MRSAPAVAFDYRPSRWVAAGAAAVVALAALAPWLSASPAAARVGVSLLALAAGAAALGRYLRPRFVRVACRAAQWTLVDAAGAEHAVVLESQARLGALIALGFRHGARARFRVVLAPDNLDAETRRRLVLLLARGEFLRAP